MTHAALRQPPSFPANQERARAILESAGLRPTRQRLALTELLFSLGGRHVSAESLFAEVTATGAPGSLSCVYNSLRRFHEVGLIRRVPIYGSTTYYDTQIDDHHHFHVVDEDRLIDVPGKVIALESLPEPPEGYDLIGAELVLRLRRRQSTQAGKEEK